MEDAALNIEKDAKYWSNRFANAICNDQYGGVGPNDCTYSLHSVKDAVDRLHSAVSFACVGYGHSFAGLTDDHPLAAALHSLGEYVLSIDIVYWRGIFSPEDFDANQHLREWEPIEWRSSTGSTPGGSTWRDKVPRILH